MQPNYAEIVRQQRRAADRVAGHLWEFLALGDGAAALATSGAQPGYVPEEGESRAHTFHWIRNLAALGTVDTTVTADHPLAAVFSKNGARTYVAANITAAPLTVTFSDGTSARRAPRATVRQRRAHLVGRHGRRRRPRARPRPRPPPRRRSRPRRARRPHPTPPPTPTPTPDPHGAGHALPAVRRRLVTGAAGPGDPGRRSARGPRRRRRGRAADAAVFTATGLSARRRAGRPHSTLAVDAGTAVGNGTARRCPTT